MNGNYKSYKKEEFASLPLGVLKEITIDRKKALKKYCYYSIFIGIFSLIICAFTGWAAVIVLLYSHTSIISTGYVIITLISVMMIVFGSLALSGNRVFADLLMIANFLAFIACFAILAISNSLKIEILLILIATVISIVHSMKIPMILEDIEALSKIDGYPLFRDWEIRKKELSWENALDTIDKVLNEDKKL